MTLQEYFRYALNHLNTAGLKNCSFEARSLICQVLKLSTEDFIIFRERPLEDKDIHKLNRALERRCKKEPLAKIVGIKEFWGLPFKVNEYTLDPRPDSETLVEAVLKSIKDKNDPLKILDLGTGSGCLILSLLHELKNAYALAIDICDRALAIALENARLLSLEKRCALKKSNWFDNICGTFDMIISNPPYIPEKQLEELGRELHYDPKLALTPGPTGLESYRAILKDMHNFMEPKTKVFFEMGWDQSHSISKIIEQQGFIVRAIHPDLANRPRVIEFNR